MSSLEVNQQSEGPNDARRIGFLLKEGFVTETMGSPRDNNVFSFATWTRKPPGEYLLYYIGVARFLNPNAKLIVVVDDLLSKEVFKRTEEDQETYNKDYKRFIESSNEATITFTSDFLTSEQNLSNGVLRIASNLSLNSFTQLLPEEKRKNIAEIGGEEFIHAIIHLLVLDHLTKSSQTLITGKNTRAMLAEHRNINKKSPLSGIFLPFFSTPQQEREHIDTMNKYRKSLPLA